MGHKKRVKCCRSKPRCQDCPLLQVRTERQQGRRRGKTR